MAEEQQLKGTEDEEIGGVTSQDPNANAASDADTLEEWKRQSRKWEKQARASLEKAQAYDALKEETDQKLKDAQEEAQKLKDELKSVKQTMEHDKLCASIAREFGIPQSLVRGSTEEEMRDFAKELKAFTSPKPPTTSHAGKFDARGEQDNLDVKRALAAQIFSHS